MTEISEKKIWPPNFQAPPWGDAPSIYAHIAAHINPDKPGLSEGGERLPDEPERDPGQLSWAAGALDGVMGHHGSLEPENQLVDDLYAALKGATENGSDRNIKTLYAMTKDGSAIDVIDALIEKLCKRDELDPDRTREIALWFASKGADREAVKFAMALLGTFRCSDDSEIFLTLGRHDEFTLYSAVAISEYGAYGENVLFQLAKAAEGWGRIGTVERLEDTQTPEIKDWLIREGFKNSVMYEYLACICARAGELHLALQVKAIDDELFESAIDIVEALIFGEGGPAEGLADYEHGCAAITSLLRHGQTRFGTATHYRFLSDLKDRVEAHLSGDQKIEQDWTDEAASAISFKLDEIQGNEKWPTVIRDALENGDEQAFWAASQASSKLGIDPWPHFFRRTEAGEDYWWGLMRTSDNGRLDQILELAKDRISLAGIATGPGDSLGFGPDFADHTTLDYILQDIGRFPGKGWAFIKAGLQSPVIRNRNLAIRALSEWGQDQWPVDAMGLIRTAAAAEPKDDVRERFEALMQGDPIS